MTSPLHDAAWLHSLRTHRFIGHQLVGHLLTDTGPKLTMYWLDLLAAGGPRTGIPGLYTLYDVNQFSRRYEALVEQRLAQVYPTPWLTNLAVAKTFDYDYREQYGRCEVPASRNTRRRRCRLAVWVSLAVLHLENPPEFLAARLYEADRYRPYTPYLS